MISSRELISSPPAATSALRATRAVRERGAVVIVWCDAHWAGGVARVPADTEVFWRWLFLPDRFSAGDRIEVLQTYPPVKACARMQHPSNLGWQKREPSGWSPKQLRVRGGCEPNNQGQLPADC